MVQLFFLSPYKQCENTKGKCKAKGNHQLVSMHSSSTTELQREGALLPLYWQLDSRTLTHTGPPLDSIKQPTRRGLVYNNGSSTQ